MPTVYRSGGATVDSVWQDVRHAFHALRRSPLFTLVSVMSIAVGIAGTAIVFNIADSYLVRPRGGMADVDRLVEVGRSDSGHGPENYSGEGFDTFSYPNYLDYRSRQTVFEGLAASRANATFGLGADGITPVRVTGSYVSANYFTVLGVRMQAGRGFRPEEESASPVAVAVLGDRLWRTVFDADRSIVGRTIRLNGRPFTVIGVTTPEFSGYSLETTQLWVPLTAYPDGDDLRRLTRRGQQWLMGVGRLKRTVTTEQAQAQFTRIARDLEQQYPEDNARHGLAIAPAGPIPPSARAIVTRFVVMLFALAGVILALACANVSGMVLARGVTRTREIALRLTLGAGRGQIARLLAIESVIIAVLASFGGIAGTWIGIRLLKRAMPILNLDIAFTLGVDSRVLAFAILMTTIAGLASGLLPSLRSSRVDLISVLGRDSRTTSHMRMRQVLVVAQVAMAVLLIVCGLLLGRSLSHANAIDARFERDGVQVIGFNLQLGGYDPDTGPAVAESLLARVEALPAVASAAFARVVPLTGEAEGGRVWRPDDTGDDRAIRVNRNFVSPGYFATIGLPLVAGRPFDVRDRAGAPAVAIVNETFAKRVWPGQNPEGQRLVQGVGRRPLVVVGLARDAKYRTIGEGPQPFVYVPAAQAYDNIMWLLVKPRDASAVDAIRAVVTAFDPNLPLVRTATLTEMGAFTLFPQMLVSWLTGAMAALGVLLAATGLYGMLAYHVGQRTKEIGVRMALGALRTQVVASIVSNAALLAGAGTVCGLAAAALVTRLLTGILYGVTPLDPMSFVGGAVTLAVVAVVASVIPARRAAAVAPAEALRAE